MSRIALVLLPLILLVAASCQKSTAPAAEKSADMPARAEAGATAKPASGETDNDITMRYACEHGNSVAIVRGQVARVSLADGRVVEIPRIADSSPPRYADVALSFEVGSDGATLGQDEAGVLGCREAD